MLDPSSLSNPSLALNQNLSVFNTGYLRFLRRTISSATIATTTALTTFVASVQAVTFTLPIEPAAEATGVDTARDLFGVDGSGITIGVLSDSFNTSQSFDAFGNLDTYASNIVDGYLPPGIQVLNDYSNPNIIDEGRAMLQLIHAVAPGANLAFYAVPNAPAPNASPEDLAGFGDGIRSLAAAGADIIVDDIFFLNEPEPPDGPINQAIEAVFNQGVSYFSSAQNRYPTNPIIGHPNNPGAASVGAVYYGNSEISLFNRVTQQGQLEPYSSAGRPPLMEPDFVAPDGLAISFNLGGRSRYDPDTGFYNFFGTSAAAPFTAAVAALMLEADPDASPTEIYSALRDTALPLGEPGFNFRSGYGLIQADQAIRALGVNPISVPEPSSTPVLLALGTLGAGLLLKRHQQQKVLGKAEDAFREAALEMNTETSGQKVQV